ncbi:MAG: DUF4350 domain-containing protein [Myxococcota bacterium]|nr:DUF4350 domain-containing protein [Myxococcota bacterium]
MALSSQTRRRLAHGGNATAVSAMVVILVGMLVGLAQRHPVRWDFSEDAANQLQQGTIHKLELLDESATEVRVTAFTAQQGKTDSYFKNRALKDLLEELGHASVVVEARLVDFDRDRLTAEQLGVTEYGHLVIQRGDDRVDLRDRDLFRRLGAGAERRLEFLGEAAFNRAAAQLLSKRKKVIYALRGHGERDVEERGPGGLSDLAEILERENYELKALDLFRDRQTEGAPSIPMDAAAVLLARPRMPLTVPEEDALLEYLARGGGLAVWVDPGSVVPEILDRLQVTVGDGLAMDRTLVFPYNDRPVPRYRSHPVTSDLAQERLVTVLAHIAPISGTDPMPAHVRHQVLLETSRMGWVELGGELDAGTALYEPEIDRPGPATMALAVEVQSHPDGPVSKAGVLGRAVVVGDSEFATNQLLVEGPGNASFLVNSFRWLLGDDGRLAVVGRPTKVRRLALTLEDRNMIRWLVLGLLPLITVVIGGAVWASRRGR